MTHSQRYEVRPCGVVYGVYDRLRRRFALFAEEETLAHTLCGAVERQWRRRMRRYHRLEHALGTHVLQGDPEAP